jgi:hypothetical protein
MVRLRRWWKRSIAQIRVRKNTFPKTNAAKRWVVLALSAILAFYALIAVLLILLRWIDPPFSAVQVERRLAASAQHARYLKRYYFVPIERISPHLRHAVSLPPRIHDSSSITVSTGRKSEMQSKRMWERAAGAGHLLLRSSW